uniref:WSC domain-containing protein ARB_07867-like isoform X1 n=1 Tax=Nicotiana tabacum TaxID=4097 RepID=A0A1S3X2X4_TOBAC|nr:PREDICTED: WSC domain-containing protein ARB_07867-like isoform X1 [Nicotiana tabacum]
MEFKNLSFYFPFALFLLFSTFPLSFSSSSSSSSSKQNGGVKKSHRQSSSLPNSIIQSSFSTSFDFKFSGQAGPIDVKNSDHRNGKWILLQKSIGVSAMHMQLLHNNKVVIFDRTDFGASNLSLPQGQCRYNDEAIRVDCTAHSILYDVATNTYRPLMVHTDVWCSSGAVNPNGTLIQTGGYHAGERKIRLFSPCINDEHCDWTELPQNLTVKRWYASDHILPDGRVIIVGGRRAFSYEFFPQNSQNNGIFYLPFLKETTDPKEENNLYPFLYLLPDGNIYIFANQRSVVLDYVNNKIIREFPLIPGEKRTYPATGSSVMLPMKLVASASSPVVEVMVCGGANGGAFTQAEKGVFLPASRTCGRMRITDPDPVWVMEDMPMGRVMPDMLLLPTGDVIILNGASKGTAGWESAIDPVLNPVLYKPNEPDPSKRFTVLKQSNIPRMYHSAATLLPDGRILVGGSNPHIRYNFTGVQYPTELSLEAFRPPYLAPEHSHLRPSILTVEGPVSYGQKFSITFTLGFYQPAKELMVSMIPPSFTTHSFAMNQRLLILDVVEVQRLSLFAQKITVCAPPSRNIAPPGYYMVFVVHKGVPGHSSWIRMQ